MILIKKPQNKYIDASSNFQLRAMILEAVANDAVNNYL